MASSLGLGEDLTNRLDQLARGFRRQLDGHARAGTLTFVDKVDVEGVFFARMIRMVIRHVQLAHLEPIVASLAAPLEGHLLRDHCAHFRILLCCVTQYTPPIIGAMTYAPRCFGRNA